MKKGNIKSLRMVLRYLRPYVWHMLGALLAMTVTSGTVLSFGYGLRYFVDSGLGHHDASLLTRGYAILFAVVVFFALATYVRFLLVATMGERLVADLRNDVFAKLMRMDIAFFETARTGELISRITTDTTLLQTILVGSVFVALRNLFLFAGGITLLIITSPHLTAYVAGIVPLVIIPLMVFGKKLKLASREAQQRIGEVGAHAEETIGAIRTLRAMALENFEIGRFQGYVGSALHSGLTRVRTKAFMISLVIGLVLGAVITVLWVGGKQVVTGTLSGGTLSQFVFYAVLVAGSVGAISEVFGDLQHAAGATERLMALTSIAPKIVAPPSPTPLPAPMTGLIGFENVSFSYPARPEQNALDTFNLMISPGERVALVGPSGAGKSTVFQLLLRFYDPQEGTVYIEGIALPKLDPLQFRARIGLVPQDPVIFSANAWENIRLGRPDASDAEVLEAARAAEAIEFLEALPQGLGTYLGEKGVRLSGGQKQRIAIARAIIRQPEILLLDEATSALDSENEAKVQAALERLMKGRTSLVIAHRLSTVQHADRIVLLNHGRIEAIGNHDELLHTSDLYRRLASGQFSS